MSHSSDNPPPPPPGVFVRRQKVAHTPSPNNPLDVLEEAAQAHPPRPTSRHSTIADTPLPPPPPPLRDAAVFFAATSRTLSHCVAQSGPAAVSNPNDLLQLDDMPVGALSSARDLRSNLSNPAPSSRQIANSGSATARDRVPEKDARKSHTLQPYIPTAAAAVAAAAAAAADVTIPSVPSLNLAAVSSDVGASCRPPTVAAATKPLSDAASLEQAAFLKQWAKATSREIDASIQFAMQGGPLVKYSSRPNRAPVLCTFRLTVDYTRFVWSESSRPADEKFGLETSTLLRVLVGAAAEEEGGVWGPSTAKSSGLRMVLLLEDNEKLRLEALDKVSLRYWAFALHFISEPQNRSKLLPDQRSKPAAFAAAALLTPWSIASQPASSGAGTMMLTSREEEGGVSHRASVARESRGGVMMTARTRAKETYNAYDENQLSVMRAFLSKARHGRLDELIKMLDAQMVSVDAVDEYGNTVLIVAAQNNNKKIVKAVLRRGAYIDHQNRMGQTCLHFAFGLGYADLGEYIVSKGANQALRNTYGLTCRQGLAPGNMLTTRGTTISSSSQTAVKSTTARGEGEKSSVFGYVTHRTNNLQQQQHLQESLPSQHEPEDRGSSRPKSVKRESEALPFRESVTSHAQKFNEARSSVPNCDQESKAAKTFGSGIHQTSIDAAVSAVSVESISSRTAAARSQSQQQQQQQQQQQVECSPQQPPSSVVISAGKLHALDNHDDEDDDGSSSSYSSDEQQDKAAKDSGLKQRELAARHESKPSSSISSSSTSVFFPSSSSSSTSVSETVVAAAPSVSTSTKPEPASASAPDRLGAIMSRATAALAASGALSRELQERSAVDSPVALSSETRASTRPSVAAVASKVSDEVSSTARSSATGLSGVSSSQTTAVSTAPASLGKPLQLSKSNLQRPRAVALDISSDEPSSGEGSSDSSSSSSGSEAAALISQFHRTMTAAQSPLLLSSAASLSSAQAHAAADIVSKPGMMQPPTSLSETAPSASSGRVSPPPPVPIRLKGLSSGNRGASAAGGEGRSALSPRSGRVDVGGMQRQKLRVGAGTIGGGGTNSSSLPASARGATRNS